MNGPQILTLSKSWDVLNKYEKYATIFKDAALCFFKFFDFFLFCFFPMKRWMNVRCYLLLNLSTLLTVVVITLTSSENVVNINTRR